MTELKPLAQTDIKMQGLSNENQRGTSTLVVKQPLELDGNSQAHPGIYRNLVYGDGAISNQWGKVELLCEYVVSSGFGKY